MMYDRPWTHRPFKLSPGQRNAIIVESERGASVTALADRYGVHRRTIRRTIERGASTIHDVHIGAWSASFVVDAERGPIRVSEWVEDGTG